VSIITTVLGGGPLTGPVDKVVDKAVGTVAGGAANAVADSGLNAIAKWVLNGTESALEQVAHLISTTTSPDLTAAWFSSTYWRVASLAALLTVPFVFAAMLQAILRSDLAMVGKVVFTYLPVSLLAVSLAAPVTMLLLSATDQMCSAVASASIDGGAAFLDKAGSVAGGLSTVDGSPFFAVMVGLFAVAAALMLALELMVREAAVYVVVLMLPLAFAAFVWPARRIWAIRLVELLISLILSKFVIVAVLSLAGSAVSSGDPGLPQLLTATALLLLSTFAPWALLRILPFTELGAGAATALRNELPQAGNRAMSIAGSAAAGVEGAGEIAMALPGRLRRHADQAGQGHTREHDGASSGGEAGGAAGIGGFGGLGGPDPSPEQGSGASAEHDHFDRYEPAAGSVQEPAAETEREPASESPPARVPQFLADVDDDMRFDLSTGNWVKPGDDD